MAMMAGTSSTATVGLEFQKYATQQEKQFVQIFLRARAPSWDPSAPGVGMLRPMQLARRPFCALSRRPTAVQPHRPPFVRLLCTNTPPPPPPSPSRFKPFWDWTLQQRPHWRENRTEAAVIFCVFGVTGSTSVAFVRPALKHTIGLEGMHKPL